MAGLSSDQLVAVVAIIVFLIIVFWRVAIPVIVALLLAKVVVGLMSVAQQLPAAAPVAAAIGLPPLS